MGNFPVKSFFPVQTEGRIIPLLTLQLMPFPLKCLLMHRSILLKTGLLVAIGAAMAGLAQAELRKFTSKGGDKHFNAELVGYQADKGLVEVRRESGKLMKFRLDVLSEDDQEYVTKKSEVLAIGKHLRVSAKAKQGKKKVTKRVPTKTTTTPKSYEVTLRNNSKQSMKDLEINYAIVVTRDNGTGRKGEETHVETGRSMVSEVLPRIDFVFSTDSVDVVQKEPFGST